jgi:intein-encoded DNA endonuclease-like protein
MNGIWEIIMNDLLVNIDKIHTTELGIVRIKKNLELKTNDVINWCKRKIKNADKIIKNGKNWYVYIGDNVITINAKSYTIITAHKIMKI